MRWGGKQADHSYVRTCVFVRMLILDGALRYSDDCGLGITVLWLQPIRYRYSFNAYGGTPVCQTSTCCIRIRTIIDITD